MTTHDSIPDDLRAAADILLAFTKQSYEWKEGYMVQFTIYTCSEHHNIAGVEVMVGRAAEPGEVTQEQAFDAPLIFDGSW